MPDGSYAQARRARELPQWPPNSYKAKEETTLADMLGKHLMLGLLCGILAGPEFNKEAKTRRKFYIPALLFSAYGLYESYKTDAKQALTDAGKWGIGLIVGLIAYSYRTQQEDQS